MLALFLLCIFFGVDLSSTDITPYSLDNVDQHFNDFVVKYNKVYADEKEKLKRSEIFAENLKKILEHNAMRDSSQLYGETQFMDLTLEEFIKRYTGLSDPLYSNDCPYLSDEDIEDVGAPDSFDWRDHNAVTPVKNQYSCGSCYAFSAIANIESQMAIKYNMLVDLSEQQIVDCNSKTNGCWSGLMAPTFKYLMEAGGAVQEPDYPYFAYERQCYFYPRWPTVQVTGCYSYNLTSQEKVKQLLYKYGPISIAIRAQKFHLLGRIGIVTDAFCTGSVSHAALLVGYGTENGMPYWIVKNSWGPGWYDQGYFKMQRGEHAESCGMMNAAMSIAVIAQFTAFDHAPLNTSVTQSEATKKSTQTNFLNPTLNTIRSLHFNVHKCIKVSNEKTITEDVNETVDNNEDKPGAAMSDAADKRMEADDVLSETATELNVLQNGVLRKAMLERRFDVNE